MSDALVFAAAFAALFAAHMVGDHWIQSDHSATRKGLTTEQACAAGLHQHAGRRACATHVASYTAVAALALVLVAWRTGLDFDWTRIVAGLAFSAGTHYWADRRFTLRRVCVRLGKERFYLHGAPRDGHDDNPSLGTGAYALDQSFHIACLFIAALIIA